MEQVGSLNKEKFAGKFSSPEEELAYLREQVTLRERELTARGAEVSKDDVIVDQIKDYSYLPTKQVLHPEYQTSKSAIEALALNLSPEAHDVKISELAATLKEKGIKNTLDIVDALNDPHVEDDFHRFLVQYLKKGLEVPGLKSKTELFNELTMTLYEVALPDAREEDKTKGLKELISAMEQFYAGMLSLEEKRDPDRYFTLEIANPNHSDEFIIYVSVPDTKKNLFEKQILSLFPFAKIKEAADDYNIFNEQGVTMGAVAKQEKHPIFPIKTYDQFDHDPLNVLLNTFSKMQRDGEGAAIQIVFRPAHSEYIKTYKDTLDEIQKGTKVKDALPKSLGGQILSSFKDVLFSDKKKDEDKDKPKVIDEAAVENIKNKISSPIAEINIRVIVSAGTAQESEKILAEIESAFNQFDSPTSNGINFERLKGTKLNVFERDFSFRAFSHDYLLPLNFKELTSIFHFPGSSIHTSSQLKQAKSAGAAAPIDMPKMGTLLGVNKSRNIETPIYMTKEDRLRHFYTIGQTGTGKSTLLKNMIIQDIQQGEGACMIDPHGVDIIDIMASIPPERYEDVIYFDPGYTARPMGLNMLEYDIRYPEQKTFVVNEMMSIFNKLFDMKVGGGAMFEQYFRNAVLLTIDDPETGSTLLDVSRVFADKNYRQLKISRCKNPVIVQFWKEIAEKAGGESSLANIVPYIVSKFDNFTTNEIMRPIIAQQESSLNFRQIMDEKKILLVNLSKGRLGEINANLIGLIIVGKFLMAALSRADTLSTNPPPFYLYIDEFQNVTTDSISAILSEARKYKLSLNVAHQYIKQLQDNIKDAVFGNVGNIAVFRVGSDDAEYLEKQFTPSFTSKDIINIENKNAYIKMLVHGRPVPPFNIECYPPPPGDKSKVDKLKELSYLKFGKDKFIIESEILQKYKKPEPVKAEPVKSAI